MKINEVTGGQSSFTKWLINRGATKKVVDSAFNTFNKILDQSNIDVNNLTSQQVGRLQDELKNFTLNFMASGDPADVRPLITTAVDGLKVPNKFDARDLKKYFTDAANLRQRALDDAKKEVVPTVDLSEPSQSLTSPPAPSPTPAAPTPTPVSAAPTAGPAEPADAAPKTITTPGGVQILRLASRDAAGKATPTIVQYNRQKFALSDDGTWVNIMSGKPVNPALASFLQTELETL